MIRAYILLILVLVGCVDSIENTEKLSHEISGTSNDTPKIYTLFSSNTCSSIHFNAPKAINHLAHLENEYFNQRINGLSKYYGTEWRINNEDSYLEDDSLSIFERYNFELAKNGIKADSLHCTLYALEGLKAGMDSLYPKLVDEHRKVWRDREFAGWSVAHLLTKHFGWKAYLFISPYSEEYESCVRNYNQKKEYNVWKQPNIPIENLYDVTTQYSQIDSLLHHYEFGWGFSYQGWHTWITRYDTLKECNWLGTPSIQFEDSLDQPLFFKTKFTEYYDYSSHIIVFPPDE